jgi:predicted DNA-binding transcriptional regulator YafY
MKTERLIAIIMLLMESDKISASKLANMFEVTKRTIYRDIDTINMAGIPIVTTNGVNGGISIMKNYKIDKSLFRGIARKTDKSGNKKFLTSL